MNFLLVFLTLSVTKSHHRDHKRFNPTIFILFISLTQSLFFPFPATPPICPVFLCSSFYQH